MVEQERGAVDQGPRDVLGGGEPPYGGLLDAHLQIVPQADEHRVGLDRPLGKLELVAQLLELGIDRQGALLAFSASTFLPEFRVDGTEIAYQQVLSVRRFARPVRWPGWRGNLPAG